MKLAGQLLFLLLLAISCATEKPKDQSTDAVTVNPDGTRTIKSFYKNKKVRSVVIYKDGVRNGIAQSYDENGNLLLEVNYVNDKREGQAKRFYTGGAVFQITEYRNDVMHGKQFKFRGDGTPISEARYENDHPCLGLKEFLGSKKQRTKFPQIVIAEIDHIDASGQYTLEVSMNPRVKKVKYYMGKLTPSGCLSDFNIGVQMDESRHVGLVRYHLLPGDFVMEEVNIVAIAETLNGNSYVCQKTFNVAIKN